MPRGKAPQPTAPIVELDGLFQSELQTVNEDIRRKAALSAFEKLRPSNRVTLEQFLSGLQRHKDIWAAVSTLGIVDFASALIGRQDAVAPTKATRRRTRLNDEQKSGLKNAILLVLEGQAGGKNRSELTAAIAAAGLAPAGIESTELAEKLRQPLQELVATNKLHTVGEKRLMKYVLGGKRGR